MVAKKEGILAEDTDHRWKDILIHAAYYHDIGRIGDVGPHAKRGARLVKKMNLSFEDGTPYSDYDMSILQSLIYAHDGKDKNIGKVINKFGVKQEDKAMVEHLIYTLKDADALDRNRLDINYGIGVKTDLNPKYLRLDMSKRLVDATYTLEALVKNVQDFSSILDYKTDRNENKVEEKTKKEQFIDGIKQEIAKAPQIYEKSKKTLGLMMEQVKYLGLETSIFH